MPDFIASQTRCTTCKGSLIEVQWIDASIALDLHRRIEDANAVDHEAEEAIEEEADEEIRRSPQFQVMMSLNEGMIRQRPEYRECDRDEMWDLGDEARLLMSRMVDTVNSLFPGASDTYAPIIPDA